MRSEIPRMPSKPRAFVRATGFLRGRADAAPRGLSALIRPRYIDDPGRARRTRAPVGLAAAQASVGLPLKPGWTGLARRSHANVPVTASVETSVAGAARYVASLKHRRAHCAVLYRFLTRDRLRCNVGWRA
jgi:hypothetical protein